MFLVTGGTGFVGAHVVRALLARGDAVRCLVREGSDLSNLEDLEIERAVGDLRDEASLRAAMDGVAQLYHCAADYRLYCKDPEDLIRTNVDGTRAILSAAEDVGVERVVYTSSVGALGLVKGGSADEETPVSLERMIGNYKRSKYLAEREADKAAARGVPVVIVNPSTPVGELDVKPTPTGKMIVDFLNRKMPAYVKTGLNLVDVRDVAQGHLLAAEKGKVGEKYILGHRNMTLKEILDLLADITGLSAPRVRLPRAIPLMAAAVDTGLARLRGREPSVPLEGVRMSKYMMFFDGSKAVRELGMPQSSIRDALARAVDWFRENGYVKA